MFQTVVPLHLKTFEPLKRNEQNDPTSRFKDYKETWEYQEELFKGIVDLKIRNRREELTLATPNYLLFVEHPHVYTLGKSGDLSNLLLSEKQLEKTPRLYKIKWRYHVPWTRSNCRISDNRFRKLYRHP
jgi:lipoyl(octanoyl) transferase